MVATGQDRLENRRKVRRTTIADVAAKTGTTKGTVSRALNDYPDISLQTRQHVKRVASELGYRPLSQAQVIRTGRMRSLGFVLQTNDHDSHRPFLAGFLAGISRAATAQGWSLTVASADSDKSALDTIYALAAEWKADGFILPRPLKDDPRIRLLQSEDIPFVLFGRTCDFDRCSWYDILGETAISDAVERLHALGHRRIGFVNGGSSFCYSIFRLQGYLDGLRRCGLAADHALIADDAVTTEQGRIAALSLLRQPLPPTAIVYAVDMAALGLYQAADMLQLEIGQDVSVISYDGIPEGGFARPPLTTFSVDLDQAGEKLGQLLIDRICGTEPAMLRETEPAEFLQRDSDQPPIRTSEDLAVRIGRIASLQPSQTKGD